MEYWGQSFKWLSAATTNQQWVIIVSWEQARFKGELGGSMKQYIALLTALQYIES